MTTNSNDSKRNSRELQIPSGQTSKSRTTKPAVSGGRNQPQVRKTTNTYERPATTSRGSGSSGKKRPSKKKMSKRKKFKLIYILLAVILVLSFAGIAAANYAVPAIKAMMAVNKNRDSSYSDSDVNTNFENENDAAHMKGYLTLAVFGIDTRTTNDDATSPIDDSDSRSDVIMIINVNRETKQIKLLSVYRDTYLSIGTDKNGKLSYDKINHAYSKGQALNAINALNRNLDLNITDYVTVNFSIVAQCVDAVGGIEVEILDREIERFNRDGSYRDAYPLINHYIDEINELTDSNSPHITKSGLQHLDGVQATAYARVRYCDTDYQRSERQRTVLMKMFEKAKDSDIGTILKIAEAVAPQLVTSLDWSEISELAKYALGCEIVDQQGFPFTMSESNHLSGSSTWYNFADDLVDEVSKLHYYFYEQKNYKPTSTVQTISDYIDKKRGKSSGSTKNNDDDDYTSKTTTTYEPDDEEDDDEIETKTDEPVETTTVTKTTAAPTTEKPDETVTVITKEPEETEEPTKTEEPIKTEEPKPTVVYTATPATEKPATEKPAETVEPTENPEDEEPDDTNNDLEE